MASGDLINLTNYKAMETSTAWRATLDDANSGTHTFIVTAPVFESSVWIKGSGLWGYQEGGHQVYPYDPNTGTFSTTPVLNWSDSVRGSGNENQYIFHHNCGPNGGSPGKDIHDCHIWKVVCYLGANDGFKKCWIHCAGLNLLPEATYNSYFKGRKIYASSGDYWRIKPSGSTYSSIEACLAGQGYSSMRGTPIAAAGNYKYLTANHEN